MEESIKQGHHMAGLTFGPDYTECMFDRMKDGLQADNDTLICSSIGSYADTTNFIKIWTLAIMLLEQMNATVNNFVHKMNLDVGLLDYPIEFLTINNQKMEKKLRADLYMISSSVCFFVLLFFQRFTFQF